LTAWIITSPVKFSEYPRLTPSAAVSNSELPMKVRVMPRVMRAPTMRDLTLCWVRFLTAIFRMAPMA